MHLDVIVPGFGILLKNSICSIHSFSVLKNLRSLSNQPPSGPATKYKNTVTNFFANKGVRAECIKLNGAVEIASNLGICSYIVDLVSTGRTLSENELVEQETLFNITSKLIVNKIALKVMNPDLEKFIRKFQERING